MLNIFPIQFLALFAYMILRVGTGLILMHLGLTHIRNRHTLASSLPNMPRPAVILWCLGLLEILVATMLVLGFLTQLGALLIATMSLVCIITHNRFGSTAIPGKSFYLLLLFVSLSLLITGAGAFAFDLPI